MQIGKMNRIEASSTIFFYPGQDIDLVIEGSALLRSNLLEQLKEKFPYKIGEKDIWEVISLRTSNSTFDSERGVIDDENFLNQNTDSLSLGMIELTAKRPEEFFVIHASLRNPAEKLNF